MSKKANSPTDIVIVSGMSGAGKSVAIQAFEDMGYFCLDNMPPSLLDKFYQLVQESGTTNKIAVVVDIRSRIFYDQLLRILADFEDVAEMKSQILFLDATDMELVARYKETRRVHPLATNGRLIQGIQEERQLVQPVYQKASLIIDTTDLTAKQLREKIFNDFADERTDPFHIVVMSFGFKYGVPIDADDMMDVRFLPNPFYIPKLKSKTGLQQAVADYVFDQPMTKDFYQQYLQLLTTIIPGYYQEGKASLTIAIGCTGGQHRSVAIAQKLGTDLQQLPYPVEIIHRDIDRHQQ
ncbi:RNase adapter RapZ [Bombilactobacillus thymidiniphilus]|uniref:RNase adapter RapZ n=1 Tax=Bombilactobacillus thymidiniphilus TaxID=2923363 RepID=A0ABY4PCT3_9LACO|nr:RNase adapter RapZ [Bombilactobacillus thymidiniphilus]UQS83326.1 RNase adapter RapZ [Bombilactobacillus thymidiniphilus]